ncbi:MAG: hypothetical protein EAZ60_02150 [Oscillatoriales cyanobacterium]|nr:MAG: hypothetical protein EAZ83_16800 [Oscillatoriales cyanobacterium]TAF18331.1 MAG: hypothetical protein EAZ73_18100 [Oscillatoriales cyanobacterium]TAF33569.1 MAG: hypothetical protein EAZ69_15990 [Oscillatoriales cyanobacterium]TAF58627.1 MAG: hypothetical protein EAZ60_02150 [Oscillatoriales cyanobacterium]
MRISAFARICVMTLKRSRLLQSIRSKSISIPQAKSAEPNPTSRRILADRSQRAPNIDRGVPIYYEDRKLHCADCGKQ